MVRETRHLWVGNLPENIREDRIRDHFKRYGRVQSVKLLPRGEECPVDGGSSSSLGEGNEGGSGSNSGGGGGGGGSSSTSGGASATVAFMDIKSAAKAHAIEHTLDERILTTQYYEPQHLQPRFASRGSSEDHGSSGGSGGGGGGTGGVSGGGGGGSGSTGAGVGGSGTGGERGERGSESFDSRGSHGSFYSSDRNSRVVGGSSSGAVVGGGVGGHPADPATGDPGSYISRGRPPASSYHVTSSRARDRLYPRSGPYITGPPPPPPHLDRHRGSLPPSSWSAYEPAGSRYGGAPPPPSPATNDAYQDEQGVGGGGGSGSSSTLRQHKKQRRKSRSGSSSPSGSSRSGSSSSSRSGSSGGSSSGSTSPGSPVSPHRTSNAAVAEDRRPLAICVRNLPIRSSDTSLKDGLFHEYKKHGKVTWVKVVGSGDDRYALVCFKKPEDVEKALEVSQDKLFFGCKIEVAPYQGYDVEDNEFRPYEAELDEYHPKATRTLFIGNLEKDVTASELRKHFEPFGEIIEIDIKKQGAVSSYAFCQYSDIGSVVKAMRSMDGEHLGANRIKLGFGKSMPTACVWVDGIGDGMSEKYLNMQFHQFGSINQVAVDRERGHALVFFDQISCAQTAVKEMRGAALRGRRLQVDFASRECQETFYEHLERQGNSTEKTWESRPSPASSFDVVTRERSSFDSAVTVSSSSSRFTRYDTPPRSRTASYSRTSGGSTPGASPAHPTAMSRSSRRSYQDSYYDGDYGEPTPRRFRSYDEFSQGSGTSHDDYQSSVLSDGKLNDDECPPPSRRHTVQSVVTNIDPPALPPPLLPPPDIRHLQKERVHLLEQLEECQSSGDEVGFVPKKRAKLDSSSTTILCEDDEPEIASLLVTSHSSRKSMEFRRVSDSKVVVHHGTRRSSCEGRGPAPCKRRRDATSRHHEHHDGSRPGTPLVDERPENLVPSEPRRFRERSHEGPLSLPLPRFAAQMLNNNNNNNNNNNSNNNNGSSATRLSSASLSKVASPPCASLSTAPSPRAAPQPPASPPPRHTSSSPTSSDSETAPQSPTLEERIRSLDEMYEKWSGSRALSAASGDALAKLDVIVSERFRFPHKLLENDYKGVEPSEIMKSVLAKRSVFEEDSKRLENFSEKYEPREFTGVSSMIGSTAGLTTSGGCTGKVCLQYPFPSHPPVQSTSGTSVNSQVGINTSALSANMIPTTTVAPSTLKTDPRMVHICMHPTPATPITPGTSVKTVSPELPPVSLPIGLGSGTVANSSGNGSDLASASSLLSSNGSVSNIHTLGASTHRGLTASIVAAMDTSSASVTTTIPVTKSCPIQTIMTTSATTTTTSATDTSTSMTTTVCSVATASSTTALSTSSSLSSSSQSSTELPRSRLKKENSGRESRDSRDGKDSRESKHNKGKDCQRRSLRKEEIDVERNRKDRDERENTNVANDIGNTDIHSRDFKDNKELRYERKERDKEDRDRQERKEKEDRDRQEKKERDEREKREKDEEKREKERLDKERQEKDRKEREEREKERERREKEENELKEKERREKERIDREKREREEKERQERREREERERKEREERERKEREIRLEREKQEKERLRREREEQERRDKEERERLERERRREEKERLERERKREREEKEKLERERRKEKEEREKAEKEKYEKEERERLDKERHEKRREREEQEKREKEKMEREKRRDREEKEKEKRERDDSRRQSTENHLHSTVAQPQTQVVPAPVPVKRRCSSQDGPTDEDAKRMKISDHRRDSKDRSRQNRRSEDRKHRNDSHRSSRDSRDNRDNGNKDSGNVIQDSSRDGTHGGDSARENNSRDSGSKEKQKSKRNRSEKESRERSPRVSHESDKEYLTKLEFSKRNDSSLPTEPASNHTRDVQHQQQQQQQQQHSTLNSHSDIDDCCTHEMQVTRNPSATDTDSDEPKKHSIFDIVVDEPAYISMYDKVKARSTKNMQKLEEEKRQVRLKDKFSQLKQSRARREEKKQSTSWDGDSVSSKALTEDEATSESDSTRTKSLSRKGSRSRIHSDTSEEEEPFNNKVACKPVKTERYIESDVDFNFADTDEKPNSLETPSVVVNSVHANIKEEPRTSDEDERISVGFRRNHTTIVNNHERDPRKKSHKKKQKRQKNSGNENNLKMESTETLENKNKTNAITSNAADCRPNHGTELNAITTATSIVTTALENEERMRADKKQRSKKDKRRDRNGEDKAKARRKRLNRQEARDSQRMEDIFGPLSDDVDDASSNTFFNRFDNIATENNVYASDSDGGRSSLDMDRVRRKTEKKRRHQLEDENSVDLAEAGREIEAKLLGIPSSPKSAPACTEPSDHDVFRFTDDNDSVEPSTPSTVPEKVKEKKKKRKKSKEERSRKDYHHHHHHHHHHHEKSGELPYLGAEPSPPRASSPLVSKTVSPSLPTPRETLLSPIPKVTSGISAVTSITPPAASGSTQTSKQEKKKDKFIPGFGIEIDETIHENAVKSISEPEERDGSCQSRSAREEPELPVQTIPPTQISPDGEDKPRVAISQEETEDAVAALLEETFGASTEDFSYEGEEEEAEADGVAEAPAEAPQEDVEEMQQAVESLNASTGEGDTTDMKPDTPQSEHDLQIDTDTEEDPNYETVDLTQPPKTPDIPSFYKSPTKTLNMTPVLSTPEKSVRLSPPLVTKPQSPPTSVIAHSWTLSENNKSREPVKPAQVETTSDADADACATSPERTAQVERASASPPPSQYKQPMLVPCSVPIATETPKSLPLPSSPRPSPITVQPLYQRLPVSPQSQMVPMRQASPKLQNPTTVSCASTNATLLPSLVSSRIPSLVMSSQSSPRVSQPLSPNGQWSRNPTLSPHVSNVGKKSSPPPTKIAVCMPIPAHSTRPEISLQQVYSTAATQQPVIQHASGMLAPVPCYPRGGLPPLTLNIPPRPYMPVPPLASGVQVKNSRDSSLGGKSVIETLLPVNPNEPPQRLEDPKLSPAVIPETTHKASTSPKVPSPNQPPTYIPETAKIDITANMPSSIFSKPCYLTTDSYTMPSRTQKQISISITTDSNLLSPRQKQEMSNVQLLTTHVPRSSTPSPVIVAHGQSHLLHKSVHSLGPPSVSSPNQPLVKTVVPVVPQQLTPSVPSSVPSDKCVITQTSLACQRQSPVSQSQLVKSHVPLVSTVSQSQSIITRVVPSTVSSVSSVSTSSINEKPSSECLEPHVIQEHPLELDAEARISEIAQPMLLTPPIQTTQPVDEIKQEPIEVKKEDTTEETEYNVADSKKPLNQTCVDDVKPKQELQEAIKTEDSPSVPKEADDTVVPKLEPETLQSAIKSESLSETKEEHTVKENDDVELDEEPVEDPLKEPRTDPLAIDSKDDPTDSKEDSDYWSAKEVNIESVIKKVDALCDGEGNDSYEEIQRTESANSDSRDTSKNESDWFDAESAESETKKSFASTDDHDESAETCENEVTRSRRGRAKSRRGSRGGGVTTRRGRNASNVSHKRGGRSPRGSKHHVEKSKLPADVYEFHDDSEEDNAGRPRLILTIKSPGPNVTGPNAQPATPVAAVKEVPPEEFVSPAANTRKSRRLAERDGSRNTVDDVIEDVVRGSPANKGLVNNAGNVHATRRSTRHNNTPRNATQPPVVPLTELRKSTRGGRKAARRASENNDDSGEEKPKEVSVATQQENKPSSPNKEEPKPSHPESPKAEEPQVAAPAPQKAISLEPMTLIDPVTGMLIPMRESEEGQYIPVSTSGQAQNANKTLIDPRNDRGLIGVDLTGEAPRVKAESAALSAPVAETKKEIVMTEQPSCPPTQQIQPQTSVITKPQSPAVQVTSTITVAQSSAACTPTSVVTTVIPTTAVQAVPVSSQTKPTSFKAHVLNASKLATSTQQQVAVTKPMPPSLPNQTIVQNIVKPLVQHVQSVQALNLQIPPGRVSSPSLSPCAKQAVQQQLPSNGKQGQPMSPVLNNTGVPPNPKQHLLQAAKQQTTTIVNMLPINLHSNVNAPSSRIHQPVSQPTALKGINGQPHPLNPKAHLLQAVVPPLITGPVTSSPSQPHLVNPQPISTGVSNVRPPGPKAPITSTMEPQKVELPISGCIMPTTSPQARSNPIPTFEAPLHGTGATPPGGQYGLIPPHRSQSPPLPPPAHHHVPTSQSEVVNHYGGLARGELPPHYLHSQMFQYQYHLRAQQEALTAPRMTPYHIPPRSPHLPLDPKLETGLEDTHSPPLELRRGTRTPQDRTTDSPQVAQVYMLAGGVRLPPPPPQYNAGSNPSLPGAPVGARAGYYEPPPAHLRSQYPMPASEAPPEMGRAATPERCRKHQVVTPPPYASQVPPQADSFQMLLQRYPLMWQGLLALKNDQAAVQMHFVFGNPNVARDSLPCNSDGSTPPLRIAQRMRLEQTQVEGVARKMQTDNEHCMLLALPCGRDEVDVLQQSKNLQSGFIMYLQQKQAAGIVNIAVPGSQQPAYVVHIFPSCDFAHENLARIAPDLLHRVAKIAHLLIVIATV